MEEQFYLLWPLLLVGLLSSSASGRTGFSAMLGLALCSTVLMALLYQPIDPSRSYYGTDTRIGGLLLGCCLALVWHPRQLAAGVPPVRTRSVSTGVAGIVALVARAWSTGAARSSTAAASCWWTWPPWR